jgi:hypothetical protein
MAEVILLDSTSLDLAFNLAVLEDPDRTNLGKGQLGTFKFVACASIGISERLVPTFALESWITRILSSLNSSEECFEGLIQPSQNVLETVSIH